MKPNRRLPDDDLSKTRRRPPGRRIPGEEGIWVLIFGDLAVFAFIFGVYMYYRGAEPEVFMDAQRSLNQNFGAFNTVLLLVSSLLVVLAVHTVRTSNRRMAKFFLAGALLCGLGFSAIKFVEYGQKFADGIFPTTNSFFMYYFVLTGLHFFHVLIGMGVLLALIALSVKGELTDRHFSFFEGGACFWHMVDLLWIILFPLVYLVK
ncbi:cytochrome C oxidase subunit III [Rhodococcus sp. SC4]|nr:cytochrome C oxidase subunit III [Rhodococcus sp. SC4]